MRSYTDNFYYLDDKMTVRSHRAIERCGLNVDMLPSAGSWEWPEPLIEGQVFYPKMLTPMGHTLMDEEPVTAVRDPESGKLIWRLTPGA